MNKEDIFYYWIEASQYDLETADAMFKASRFVYVVFMCQQSLEKLLKGLYAYYVNDQVPRVHNIGYLAKYVSDALHIF